MKKSSIYITVFLIAFFVIAGALPCSAGEDPVKEATDAVLGYFVPVSGTVESVSGDKLRVRIEAREDVPANLRLTVFREGEPFYHPVTNEKIGGTEFPAGRAEIKGKYDGDLYSAELKSGEAKAGDQARLVSARIKLAFFQERKSDWALSELFYNSLKNTGRFEIVESYTPSYEPEKLSKLAADLGAEAVLLFSTPVRNDKKVMDIKLFWSSDNTMLAEIEKVLDREIDTAIPGDEFLTVDLIANEPWNSYSVENGRMMAVGDINNNGEQDFVVSDGNNIRIYSRKTDMREEWKIKGAPSERHLSIDIADINNNGYAEIFVTSMISDREMRSFVLEYRPSGDVEKVRNRIPYFLRVSGEKLLMQEYGYIHKYKGPVYEAVFEDGEYSPGRPLDLPGEVNIYGFTGVDWRENGNSGLLTYDDSGYLYLYDGSGSLIWKSEEAYGAPDLSFKRTHMIPGSTSAEWFVREKIVTLKTDRGQEVFVLKKIPSVKIMPGLGYDETEVYSLWWNGAEMESKTVLKGIPGAVNDFWVADSGLYLIVKGGMFSLVKNSVTGDFTKGSMIYYYNIKGK